MARTATIMETLGLDKARWATLRKQAKALDLTPEKYARQLILEGISLEQRARTQAFDELFAPVQQRFQKSGMTEAALDKLVDEARTRHHQGANKRKR